MKRVYVAGAYSANNVIDVLKNIGRGEEYASKVFLAGFAPFCPWHDKEYVIQNWEENFTVEQFYNYSMAWLEVSNAVLVIPSWEDSKGTFAEINRAKELNIPVYYSIEDLIANENNFNEKVKKHLIKLELTGLKGRIQKLKNKADDNPDIIWEAIDELASAIEKVIPVPIEDKMKSFL